MADILQWTERITRKSHECVGCGLTYTPGTKMVYASWADEGTIRSCYWCETCQEYMARHIDRGEEIDPGALLDNDPERWQAISQELHDRKKEHSHDE